MCGGRWRRSAGQEMTVTVTPVSGVLDLSMEILTINRETGDSMSEEFSAGELAAGIGWTLEPGMTHQMLLLVVKQGQGAARVKPTLTLNDEDLWNQQCSRGTSGVMCRWVMTARKAGA